MLEEKSINIIELERIRYKSWKDVSTVKDYGKLFINLNGKGILIYLYPISIYWWQLYL